MSFSISVLFWAALVSGTVAASIAFYGRYRMVPSWLTGPNICKLEGGGCEALFRTKRAALLGVPNSALALCLYGLLAIGRLGNFPVWILAAFCIPAVCMTVYLGWILIKEGLECRICWLGHFANAAIFALLLGSWAAESRFRN